MSGNANSLNISVPNILLPDIRNLNTDSSNGLYNGPKLKTCSTCVNNLRIKLFNLKTTKCGMKTYKEHKKFISE